MKRPILIATIGYIIGIIVGLYFNKSIVLIYCPIVLIYYIFKFEYGYRYILNSKIKYKELLREKRKLNIFSIKRYIRYFKIFINKQVFIVLIISSIISNTIILLKEKNYNYIYESLSKKQEINVDGIIISNAEKRKYNNKYKVKLEKQNINLYIITEKDVKLNFGDKISIKGKYIKPEIQRNYKGFDYSQYLKQFNVYGTINCNKVEKISDRQINQLLYISNNIENKIIENINSILDEEEAAILLGLILGKKDNIKEEVKENFQNASMLHILAVSGMHISFIIIGIKYFFEKLLGKRKTYFFLIIILIFYMFITNFTPSITRAGIMGIIFILSKLIYKKNDIFCSISFSLIIILIYNPFLIQNIGLQLSYSGILGIIVFNKIIKSILDNFKIKNKVYKYKIRPKISKILEKIKDVISISISVQIAILPIIISEFNIITPYFLISNLILSIAIGPIIIICFIFTILSCINISIATILSPVVKISIFSLNIISYIGKLPFSRIYIPRLQLCFYIIYFLLVLMLIIFVKIYLFRNQNPTEMRIRNYIALFKIKFKKNKNKIRIYFYLIISIVLIINIYPKNLKIDFIDVGQGDSTLIITPYKKTILIDGGGSNNSENDVGKNTLLPYILDRGFREIDYIVISHFDSDHVRTGC